MSPKPYWTDGTLTLYLGDMREVAREVAADMTEDFDAVIADPPYGETHYRWDTWPEGWVDHAASVTNSLFCFGSSRMFLLHAADFAAWQFAQDLVWRKIGASGPAGDKDAAAVGFVTDRFRRGHEMIYHWYQGKWADVWHSTPREKVNGWQPARTVGHGRADEPGWWGKRNDSDWVEDGTRIRGSVLDGPRMWKRNIAPTQKPEVILTPLIEYAVRPGGIMLDPFAGSGSALSAARAAGRRAVGIEGDERQLERTVLKLAQEVLDFDEPLLAAPPAWEGTTPGGERIVVPDELGEPW